MRVRWWNLPLYCILAVLPLGAAFWAYGMIPNWVEVMPGVYVPTERHFIWVLPMLHVLLAIGLYVLTQKMSKKVLAHMEEAGRKTDLADVLPWLRLFLLVWLTAICLAVVYGHYVLDTGQMTLALIGRASAVIPGAGVSVWALRLPMATRETVLALRFVYTEKSPQVWLRIHKLAVPVLYVTGALMILAGILFSGLQAVGIALLALFSALLVLYLYAKYLYENEFYR